MPDSLATAAVDIIADSSDFEDRLESDLAEAGKKAGRAFNQAFQRAINNNATIDIDATSQARTAGKQAGNAFSRAFNRAVSSKVTSNIDLTVNAETSGSRTGTGWISGFASAVKNGLSSLAGSISAALSRITKTSSGVGKGLSGLGKSTPVVGIVTAVIGAAASKAALVGLMSIAAQAAAELSSLAGFLGALPAVGAAAAASMVSLKLALHGVGDALSAGLAGKTQQFQEALAKLAPAAQKVVKTIVDMKGIFSDFQGIAQQAFFKPLIDSFNKLQQAWSSGGQFGWNNIRDGLRTISSALGKAAATIVDFLGSFTFSTAFRNASEAVASFVNGAAKGLPDLLQGIASAVNSVSTLFEDLGKWVGKTAAQFGKWLTKVSTSGQLNQWIKNAVRTFQQLWAIVKNVGLGILRMFTNIDNATKKGEGFLATIKQWSKAFAKWAGSKEGKNFAKNIVQFAKIAMKFIKWLIKKIPLMVSMFTGFASVLNGINNVIRWILGFVKALTGAILNGLVTAFTQAATGAGLFAKEVGIGIGKAFMSAIKWTWRFVKEIGRGFANVGKQVAIGAQKFWGFARDVGNATKSAIQWVGTLPGKIRDIFAGAGTWLLQAGKNIIQGLIDGIRSMIGNVGSAIGAITSKIGGFLPHSPAKEGPLSGAGSPEHSGRKIGSMVATGISGQRGAVNSAMRSLTAGAKPPPFELSPMALGGAAQRARQMPPTPAGIAGGYGNGRTVQHTNTTTIESPQIQVASPAANPDFVARRTADRLARMATA